jgi:Ser-tRNA(Ala) deacylase AlaX
MATESCTTTMRPHTLHMLCSSFWSNTAPLSCSSRHTHQISHRVTLLYPKVKKILKGHQFEATEDIKRNSTKTLLEIPKEEIAKLFQQWQKSWAKCVAAEGNYVEDK